MGAGSPSTASAECDQLPGINLITLLNLKFRKMQVQAHQTLPVIDDNETAFEIERTSKNHRAAIDGMDLGPGRSSEIQPEVPALHLVIENTCGTEHIRNRGRYRSDKGAEPELFSRGNGESLLLYSFVGV